MSQSFGDRDSTLRVVRETARPIPTYLICSNVLLRSGCRHILAGTQFLLSSEAYNDSASLPEIDCENPVLLLICATGTASDMPQMVEGLKENYPKAQVALFADRLSSALLLEACKAGVDGVCSTDMNRDVLVKTLELVMLGERFIPASMGLALMEAGSSDFQGPDGGTVTPMRIQGSASQHLSERETQILRCLIDGSSNKHIARQLGVAEATVKVHIKAILRKAKVANRTQAAMWAQRQLSQGLIAGSDEVS